MLPDSLLTCHMYAQSISLYRQLLTKVIMDEGRASQVAGHCRYISLVVRPRGHKQNEWINMSFIFLCLCSLGLTSKLNFNIIENSLLFECSVCMCNVKASCSDLWLFSYYRGNNWFSLRLNKANIAISHQAQRKLNLCNSFCWNVFLFRVSSLIMDAVISTFRKILYTSDVMDALKVNTWLSREHTLTM